MIKNREYWKAQLPKVEFLATHGLLKDKNDKITTSLEQIGCIHDYQIPGINSCAQSWAINALPLIRAFVGGDGISFRDKLINAIDFTSDLSLYKIVKQQKTPFTLETANVLVGKYLPLLREDITAIAKSGVLCGGEFYNYQFVSYEVLAENGFYQEMYNGC